MANTSIFGAEFCSSLPVNLSIFGTNGRFSVRETENHTVKFPVTKSDSSFHEMRALHDAAGNPIATLREKNWTAHSRWEVFRGDSRESRDRVFAVKAASPIILKVKYKVFLASNEDEKVCDFTVKGNSGNNTGFSLYAGESSTIVAQVYAKPNSQNEVGVKVEANVDQAFVVAVIMILDALYQSEPSGSFADGFVAAILPLPQLN